MARVKSRNTAPEQAFRRALRRAGLRFRTGSKLPGKPDFILPSRRLAVFIDGDFWHGRQWQTRKHASLEGQFKRSATREYWLAKIRRNISRDLANTAALLGRNYAVARFWETDVNRDATTCVNALDQTPEPCRIADRTVAEFFAGIGLVRYAFERQGWRVVFANDIDPEKRNMYAAEFGESFELADVHSLDASSVPAVTLATASFPCTHSSAFLSFVRVLNDMGADRPPLVLVDNVPGFLTSKSGANLLAALEALNALGYATDIFTLDAVHFVPQSRNRLFIVGRPPGDGDGTRPAPLRSFIEAHPHVRWAIRRLPDPPEPSAKLADILDRDAEWWERPRSEYLLSQMAPSRRAAADQAIRKRRWTFGTVFRRIRNGRTAAELRLDGIAGCLCTPRGGSARQIVFRAGYGRFDVRSLNPRECARLMGAPDYTIDVPANQALFGFGDAVCVPAIEWIVDHYLTPLCNELIHGRVLVR